MFEMIDTLGLPPWEGPCMCVFQRTTVTRSQHVLWSEVLKKTCLKKACLWKLGRRGGALLLVAPGVEILLVGETPEV